MLSNKLIPGIRSGKHILPGSIKNKINNNTNNKHCFRKNQKIPTYEYNIWIILNFDHYYKKTYLTIVNTEVYKTIL